MVRDCRLKLLAEYRCGITACLNLLGLSVSDISQTLTDMKSLALARAGITQQQVGCSTQQMEVP